MPCWTNSQKLKVVFAHRFHYSVVFVNSGRKRDSLVELTELVHKGEKRGLFMDKMPARIQQVVRDENLRFMKNRGVYDVDYFRFVRDLITKSSVSNLSSYHDQDE